MQLKHAGTNVINEQQGSGLSILFNTKEHGEIAPYTFQFVLTCFLLSS